MCREWDFRMLSERSWQQPPCPADRRLLPSVPPALGSWQHIALGRTARTRPAEDIAPMMSLQLSNHSSPKAPSSSPELTSISAHAPQPHFGSGCPARHIPPSPKQAANSPIAFSVPSPYPRRKLLTILPGFLDEGFHTTFPIAALGGQGGDVVPLEGFDNVHHGLCLVGVGWDDTGEEVVAAVVAQVGRSGGVADLGDLGWSWERKKHQEKEAKFRPSPYPRSQSCRGQGVDIKVRWDSRWTESAP